MKMLFIVLAILALCAVGIPVTSATVISFGTYYNYSEVVLPNNSYVHQGENISQGCWYDLRGVYGFSGELAHWNSDYKVGDDTPDTIIELAGYGYTYIDPAKFPTGRYFQWDGAICASDGTCKYGFGHGNSYVFAVVPQPAMDQSTTITRTTNITITTANGTVSVPITYQETIQPQVTTIISQDNATVQTIAIPTTTAPTPTPTIVRVTMKSPMPIWIAGMALGLILLWRKKE
jgi:hypothetical protein